MVSVFLLKDVAQIGSKGDVISVKEGYANNFLIKQKLARIANTNDISLAKTYASRAEYLAQTIEKTVSKITNYSEQVLTKKPVVITTNSSAGGKIYAGIHTDDVIKALYSAIPLMSKIDEKKVSVKLPQNMEYAGRYMCDLLIKTNERTVTIAVPIELVSVGQTRRKNARDSK